VTIGVGTSDHYIGLYFVNDFSFQLIH
jgi:hypothetical protein